MNMGYKLLLQLIEPGSQFITNKASPVEHHVLVKIDTIQKTGNKLFIIHSNWHFVYHWTD